MTIEEIKEEINSLSDPKNAEFFLKLNPTAKLPLCRSKNSYDAYIGQENSKRKLSRIS